MLEKETGIEMMVTGQGYRVYSELYKTQRKAQLFYI